MGYFVGPAVNAKKGKKEHRAVLIRDLSRFNGAAANAAARLPAG